MICCEGKKGKREKGTEKQLNIKKEKASNFHEKVAT